MVVGSGPVGLLSQTSPIPRSPDGDNNNCCKFKRRDENIKIMTHKFDHSDENQDKGDCVGHFWGAFTLQRWVQSNYNKFD